MKKIFYIEREYSREIGADHFGGIFETELAAVKAADDEWSHLTASAQENCMINVFYGEVPEEIELDEAMEWLWDEGDGGGYFVAEFSRKANVTLSWQSCAEGSIKSWRLEDGGYLCLVNAEDN